MVKIAVYAITKNESKHVKQWVEATKGADVQIVLDTGSEDNTYDLLLQYPVEAHRATLSDFRFDVARNMALDLVPANVDVCVSSDMDKIPDPDLFDKIRQAWKPDTTRASRLCGTRVISGLIIIVFMPDMGTDGNTLP